MTTLIPSDSRLYCIGKIFMKNCPRMRFFIHAHCEFRIREKYWVLRVNNLPMPNSAPTQISKVKEPASFCNFQNRKSCVVANVPHFVSIGVVYSFCEISGK